MLDEPRAELLERLCLMLHLQRNQGMETTADKDFIPTGVLMQPESVVSQQIDASLDDVYSLYRHVSDAFLLQNISSMTTTSVADLLSCRYRHVIPTGQECLDSALNGGLGCGVVTEITGAPDAGKTAIVLNLAMHAVVYPNADKRRTRALWITSDLSAFPTTTAAAMQRWYLEARSGNSVCEGDENIVEDALRNVAVTAQPNLTQLWEFMSVLRSYLKRENDLRLVIIDNFSVMVRRSFPGVDGEVAERHEAIVGLMSTLKSVAQEFGVAVLVTTVSGIELGHSFLHAVNTRLHLKRSMLTCQDELVMAGQEETRGRMAHVLELAKSSFSAALRFECEFDGMCLTRVRPINAKDETLVEDVTFDTVNPVGHVTLPTFVYC